MKTNYNSDRQRLQLPEYGRHIQDMVMHLMEIEDRAERNLRAKALIAIMANIQHESADTPDFERKLWDHLHIMADFQLDIDSPYLNRFTEADRTGLESFVKVLEKIL